MTLAEYYGLPSGTNMTLDYSSFFDTVDSDFPCPENMSNAFYGENKRVALKPLDFSNTTNMSNMLSACSSLITIDGVENWNVSNVTNMSSLFMSCSGLETLDCSNWDTSKVKDMANLFNNCRNLISLGSLRADSLEVPSYAGLFGYSEITKLTDFGGFINLKTSMTSDTNLKKLPNLSYESCINILNGLYDFTGNGETPTASQGRLNVHQNFLNLVGDEISIGTNKGWTITA